MSKQRKLKKFCATIVVHIEAATQTEANRIAADAAKRAGDTYGAPECYVDHVEQIPGEE